MADLRKPKQSVVITGASTGIGKTTALYLDGMGFKVFAGVRREQDAEALKKESGRGITPLMIDVTDPASIAAAAKAVEAAVGDEGLWGLVNNAGIAVGGPLEFLPLDEIRSQLEINVIGQVAVTQAFLPLLRKARGRVVNIGSVSGRVATPFIGPYAMSKYAMEAFSDALRGELLPWGVQVTIIEPGSAATPIWEKSLSREDQASKKLPRQTQELYGQATEAIRAGVRHESKHAFPPELVARAVYSALTKKRPPVRTVVGTGAWLFVLLKMLLPARVLDRIILSHFGLPR
jgi:NAD(P)-dependent dehydrogenase (short-subunit alcohol dehydrogenase family)